MSASSSTDVKEYDIVADDGRKYKLKQVISQSFELFSDNPPPPPPPPPSNGCGDNPDPINSHVKPGGWGANDDASTWSPMVMRDDPNLWKIVDSNGINVAHKFASKADAEQYIAYWKCVQNHIPPPPPPPSGEVTDQFGILKIFPDKPGGITNINSDVEHKVRHYRSGKPDDWSVELSFDMPSGHQQDLECTAIVTMPGMEHNDTIDWKCRGPGHSDGNGKKWYITNQETNGGHGTTLKTEDPHPTYWNNTDKTTNYFSPPNISTAKFGWKGIFVNKSQNDVYIAAWINLTPDNELGWKKIWDIHDTGQVSHGQITPPTGGNVQIRIDGIKWNSEVKFEKESVREISYSEESASRK